MEKDVGLCNAIVVGENPEMCFVVEGNRLHAVEDLIADLKKGQCQDNQVVPLLREALVALSNYAEGKVFSHFTDEEKNVSLKPSEKEQIIEKITHIYEHLPHHDRIELSSLVHHKQV